MSSLWGLAHRKIINKYLAVIMMINEETNLGMGWRFLRREGKWESYRKTDDEEDTRRLRGSLIFCKRPRMKTFSWEKGKHLEGMWRDI